MRLRYTIIDTDHRYGYIAIDHTIDGRPFWTWALHDKIRTLNGFVVGLYVARGVATSRRKARRALKRAFRRDPVGPVI